MKPNESNEPAKPAAKPAAKPEVVAQDDKELIAAKMAAGLSHEAAVEVIERQRAEDAKAKK